MLREIQESERCRLTNDDCYYLMCAVHQIWLGDEMIRHALTKAGYQITENNINAGKCNV
jgi:hypothetical protein